MANQFKKFIHNFKFIDHNWNNVPEGFPNCEATQLSLEEKYILDGIKLAYTYEHARQIFIRKTAKISVTIVIIALVSLVSLITATRFPAGDNYAKPVSAATVSATLRNLTGSSISPVNVGNVIQSTISGILRK